ncbi:hypothetical protein RUND412_003237 [Rhizina undulata]
MDKRNNFPADFPFTNSGLSSDVGGALTAISSNNLGDFCSRIQSGGGTLNKRRSREDISLIPAELEVPKPSNTHIHRRDCNNVNSNSNTNTGGKGSSSSYTSSHGCEDDDLNENYNENFNSNVNVNSDDFRSRRRTERRANTGTGSYSNSYSYSSSGNDGTNYEFASSKSNDDSSFNSNYNSNSGSGVNYNINGQNVPTQLNTYLPDTIQSACRQYLQGSSGSSGRSPSITPAPSGASSTAIVTELATSTVTITPPSGTAPVTFRNVYHGEASDEVLPRFPPYKLPYSSLLKISRSRLSTIFTVKEFRVSHSSMELGTIFVKDVHRHALTTQLAGRSR